MSGDWMMFGACSAVFVLGCLLPNRWLPARLPNDKLLHGAAFAVLGLMALRLADGWPQGWLMLGGLLVAGWIIECLQKLVPDRDFSWPDMAANAIGLAVAAVAGLAFVPA